MDIGMLWYDDDTRRQLDEKVARAAAYYRAKYGVQPTECYVNPTMLPGGESTVAAGVRLRPTRTVLANHFWLGLGEGMSRIEAGNGNGHRRKFTGGHS